MSSLEAVENHIRARIYLCECLCQRIIVGSVYVRVSWCVCVCACEAHDITRALGFYRYLFLLDALSRGARNECGTALNVPGVPAPEL